MGKQSQFSSLFSDKNHGNLGILCLIDGDSEKARYCFSLAAEDGSGEAAYNLAHFDELSCEW